MGGCCRGNQTRWPWRFVGGESPFSGERGLGESTVHVVEDRSPALTDDTPQAGRRAVPSAEHGNPARPSSALAASEQGELKTPGRAQRPATHRLRPHVAGSQAARVRTYAAHHEASSTRTMVRFRGEGGIFRHFCREPRGTSSTKPGERTAQRKGRGDPRTGPLAWLVRPREDPGGDSASLRPEGLSLVH